VSFKFTLVLLVLAIVAVAGFGIAQRQVPPSTAPDGAAPSGQPTAQILDFGAGSVTSLDVKTKDHETSLSKDGGAWKLVKPSDDPNVDQVKVNQLVNQLYALTSQRAVANVGEDVTPYGLRTPQVTAILSGGNKTETLLIGDKNVNGNQYYASRQEGSQVGLIPAALVTALIDLADNPPRATPTPPQASGAAGPVVVPVPSASG
jgi:hypothetical protein